MLDARRRMARHAAHVHFVNHQIFDRNFERAVSFPVKIIVDDARPVLIRLAVIRRMPPYVAPADGVGIRIH